MAKHDAVHHPSHYTDGGIETIDFIRAKLTEEEFIGYCKGNALKYISRAGKKSSNVVEDLDKAIVYLGWGKERVSATIDVSTDPAWGFDIPCTISGDK